MGIKVWNVLEDEIVTIEYTNPSTGADNTLDFLEQHGAIQSVTNWGDFDWSDTSEYLESGCEHATKYWKDAAEAMEYVEFRLYDLRKEFGTEKISEVISGVEDTDDDLIKFASKINEVLDQFESNLR